VFRTAQTAADHRVKIGTQPTTARPRSNGEFMFQLVATMRRGSASGLAPAWARYASIEAARTGAAELLREDRILRVMIVRNEIPQAFVEWFER
jgi:hypothetical protein